MTNCTIKYRISPDCDRLCFHTLFNSAFWRSTDTVRFCYTPQICHTPMQATMIICRFLILINSVHKYGTLRQLQQLRSVESILLVHLIDRLILFCVAKKVPEAHRKKQAVGFRMAEILGCRFPDWTNNFNPKCWVWRRLEMDYTHSVIQALWLTLCLSLIHKL